MIYELLCSRFWNSFSVFHTIRVILKSIINATCPGHQEQVNLMLSEFPAIFDGENFER